MLGTMGTWCTGRGLSWNRGVAGAGMGLRVPRKKVKVKMVRSEAWINQTLLEVFR